MNQEEQELDSVDTARHHGEFGNIFKASPNAMYRKYRSWFDKKYGTLKKPLSFKEWLKWAHEKEMVKKRSVDATPAAVEREETEKVVEVVKNTGKKIAMLVAVVASIGLIMAFAKTKTA